MSTEVSVSQSRSGEAAHPRRGIYRAKVLENRPMCREHFALKVAVRDFPPTAPGQFVQLMCRDVDLDMLEHEVEWAEGTLPRLSNPERAARTPVLRRPFSIAGRGAGLWGDELTFVHRVVGAGTDYLSRLQAGQEIDVLGPLGNTFPLPDPEQIVLLVGGGVGIPPMMYLAQVLARPRVIAFCGALTKDLLSLTFTSDAPPPTGPRAATSIEPLYNADEFARYGIPVVVSTDDGSYGYKGLVTQALDQYLGSYFADSWEVGSRRPLIFTCGPEGMMKAVAEIARKRGLVCYAAVERAMACGMGTCQSCCIRVKTGGATASGGEGKPAGEGDWRYALACTEGPVFETSKLLW